VSEKHYERFRELAQAENRSIASLIRDAMAEHLRRMDAPQGSPGVSDPVVRGLLPGPGRYRIYAEVSDAQ
jgi:hypothetical protein